MLKMFIRTKKVGEIHKTEFDWGAFFFVVFVIFIIIAAVAG